MEETEKKGKGRQQGLKVDVAWKRRQGLKVDTAKIRRRGHKVVIAINDEGKTGRRMRALMTCKNFTVVGACAQTIYGRLRLDSQMCLVLSYAMVACILTTRFSLLPPTAAIFLTQFGATSKFVYGKHDPILMPQFLDARVIYLSLIRQPDTKPPFHILWHRPEEDEFEPMDGFKLAELPIGRLQKEFRNILELDAYITWMLRVKPTWGEAQSWRSNKTHSVVGGITDKSDLAEHSFHAGIRYDKTPPHPVIWDGSIKTLDYYVAMSKHNRSIAFPVSVFDNPEPSPPSGATSAPPQPPVTTCSSTASSLSAVTPRSSNMSSSGPGPVRTSHFDKLHKKPYPAVTPRPGRSKFEASASPLMPPLVENWVKASREIGSSFNFSQKPPQGVTRGYPSLVEVDRAEYLVAHRYIWVFSDFFRRPPTLPSLAVPSID
ncbi:hypothetical protein BDP27DRAFT_1362340 [Rhodocollybia butyracea]|uniref:Uncharacterized protein n=1 Tax=Rhodocollybia butyracea TaxID=206335 RepID=A0A9P5PYT9_9AGAR|nr:hypothetical protein BDP27DRAFT_1362340 [Rhodocollybia butyracea]